MMGAMVFQTASTMTQKACFLMGDDDYEWLLPVSGKDTIGIQNERGWGRFAVYVCSSWELDRYLSPTVSLLASLPNVVECRLFIWQDLYWDKRRNNSFRLPPHQVWDKPKVMFIPFRNVNGFSYHNKWNEMMSPKFAWNYVSVSGKW